MEINRDKNGNGIPVMDRLREELVRAVARDQQGEATSGARSARKGGPPVRRPIMLAVAAAVVLILGGVSAMAFLGGSDSDPKKAGPTRPAASPSEGATTEPPTTEPPNTGGGGFAICIELTAETLAMSPVAFDGTVTEANEGAGPSGETIVTFGVNHWYRGGTDDSVTLKSWGNDPTSLERTDLDLSVGSHLLVTADQGYLSGCGFSMPYTEQNAQLFEEAFGE
jgi:hypothetical protein